MVKEREGAKEEDERKHWVVAGLPRLPGDPPPISPSWRAAHGPASHSTTCWERVRGRKLSSGLYAPCTAPISLWEASLVYPCLTLEPGSHHFTNKLWSP